MQRFSALMLGVCFSAVLGGVVHLLSPGGRTDKFLRLLITLFVLTTAIPSMRSLFQKDFSLPTSESIQMQEKAADIVLENVKTAIEEKTSTYLLEKGYPRARTEITMCVRDGTAHTKAFRIIGVEPGKEKEIEEDIFALTGERPVVEPDSGGADSG